MKSLYDLVLKSMTEAQTSEIFWEDRRKGGYLTSTPTSWINRSNRYCEGVKFNFSESSEEDRYFQFHLKYSDGQPNVEVVLNSFAITGFDITTNKVGNIFNRKTEEIKTVTESIPIYKITAGQLSYITTAEESRKLYKAYRNLIQRDKDTERAFQVARIEQRLAGKTKLYITKSE